MEISYSEFLENSGFCDDCIAILNAEKLFEMEAIYNGEGNEEDYQDDGKEIWG